MLYCTWIGFVSLVVALSMCAAPLPAGATAQLVDPSAGTLELVTPSLATLIVSFESERQPVGHGVWSSRNLNPFISIAVRNLLLRSSWKATDAVAT